MFVQVAEAVDLTIEEANTRCEAAVRENVGSLERRDEETLTLVMEATRGEEERRCETRLEAAVAARAERGQQECAGELERARQASRNAESAECRVRAERRARAAVITDRRESEQRFIEYSF